MSDVAWRKDLGKQVRTLKIVVAGLVSGPLMLLIVVCLALTPGQRPAQEGRSVIITTIALAVTGLLVILRLIVPGVAASSARRKILGGQFNPGATAAAAQRRHLESFFQRTGDAGRLMIVYMTTTIMAGAILEGAVFLLLVAYMVEQQVVSLAVAVAILAALAAHVPWQSRVFAWIDGQLRRLDEERQSNPRRDRSRL